MLRDRGGFYMEYVDVFLRDGTPTGRVIPKHGEDHPGDYFKHAIIIMKCADSPAPGAGEGQYIMQQRSLKARYSAGCWDVTGGGVTAGETPEEAAVREAMEEVGVSANVEDLVLYHKYYADWDDGTGLIFYMFACRVEVPAEGLVYNEREVNDVKIVGFQEFYNNVMHNKDEAFGEALKRIEREI